MLVRDGGFDLQRRHALERAFDHELADRLIEHDLRAAEQAEQRARRAAATQARVLSRPRHGSAIAASATSRAALDSAAVPLRRRSSRCPSAARLADDSDFGLEPHARALLAPRLCTSSINASMSAAVALPVFTMKFACFSDTTAPPMRRPFKPRLLDEPAGEIARRVAEHGAAARDAERLTRVAFREHRLDRVERALRVAVEAERGRRGTTRCSGRAPCDSRSRSRRAAASCARRAGRSSSTALDVVPGLAAERARVHRERAADGARDSGEERGGPELPAHALLREQHAGEPGAGAHAHVVESFELAAAAVRSRSPRRECRRRARADSSRDRASAPACRPAAPRACACSSATLVGLVEEIGRPADAPRRVLAQRLVAQHGGACTSSATAFISAPRPARARRACAAASARSRRCCRRRA